MATASKARTQAERRESTIARLLDATIASLAQSGYVQSTTTRVCRDAGLSQGALFRHFASRTALLAAATSEICRRHIALLEKSLAALRVASIGDPIAALIYTIREQARSAEHAAWHEVMVAARCDLELHGEVVGTLKDFEARLLATIADALTRQFPDLPEARRHRLGTIFLSLMHLFDSEAVTTAVYRNRALEEDRLKWLTQVLRSELG